MDGSQQAGRSGVDVEAGVRLIKSQMPETYRAVQDKAKAIGREAFALVRRGIAGQPDMFYAVERGFVIGTPFNHSIAAEVAQLMVRYGCHSLVIWAEAAAVKEVSDGTP